MCIQPLTAPRNCFIIQATGASGLPPSLEAALKEALSDASATFNDPEVCGGLWREQRRRPPLRQQPRPAASWLCCLRCSRAPHTVPISLPPHRDAAHPQVHDAINEVRRDITAVAKYKDDPKIMAALHKLLNLEIGMLERL